MISGGIPVSVPEKASQEIESIWSTPQAFSITDVDQAPAPLFQLKPDYPQTAKRSNVTGKVSVMFLVDQNGNVLDVPSDVVTDIITAPVDILELR